MSVSRTLILAAAVVLGANAAYAQGHNSGTNSDNTRIQHSIYDVIRGNQGRGDVLQGRSATAEPPAARPEDAWERSQRSSSYYIDHPTENQNNNTHGN